MPDDVEGAVVRASNAHTCGVPYFDEALSSYLWVARHPVYPVWGMVEASEEWDPVSAVRGMVERRNCLTRWTFPLARVPQPPDHSPTQIQI